MTKEEQRRFLEKFVDKSVSVHQRAAMLKPVYDAIAEVCVYNCPCGRSINILHSPTAKRCLSCGAAIPQDETNKVVS